jgi:uncharacterized membrane protein HdeD (DUF308 family)
MKKRVSDKTKKIIKASVFLLLGLVFIFVPDTALSVALRIVGALLLVYEALEIYSIYKAYRESSMLILVLLNEAFMTLLSLVLLINPLGAVRIVGLVIGLYFLIFGGIGLYRSIDSKRAKPIVLNGATTLVGLLLLVLPYIFAEIVTLLIGAALIVKGVEMLIPLLSGGDKDDGNYYM